MIFSELYKYMVCALLVLSIVLGIKIWFMSGTIDDIESKNESLQARLVLSDVNNGTLRSSLVRLSSEVESLRINLDAATKQYKIKEVYITKVIEKEKESVRDLNATEDCEQAKRIANDIIKIL